MTLETSIAIRRILALLDEERNRKLPSDDIPLVIPGVSKEIMATVDSIARNSRQIGRTEMSTAVLDLLHEILKEGK